MVTRYELISPQVVKLFFSENATFFNDKSKALMWTKRSKVLVYGLFHNNLPILAVFNLWIARSISNKLLWHRDRQMYYLNVDTSRTKAPDVKTTTVRTVVDRSRSTMC